QWLMSSRSYPQTPMSYNMASYPARFDQEWLACREADCRALRSIQRKRPRVPCDRCRLQKDESNLWPHHVGSKVECAPIPVIVHVVSKVFHLLRNHERLHRSVATPADFNGGISISASQHVDAI